MEVGSPKRPLFREISVLAIVGILIWVSLVLAKERSTCEPIDKKRVKIEAWIAKRFKSQKKMVKNKLRSLGNTKVMLRVFPMKEPAHVVAIGRCVPVYIGQHALKIALKYSGGVENLVYQTIVSEYWVGIGTMAFDEYSQREISQEQLNELLNDSLDTKNFQKLVKKYSLPRDTIKVFGRHVPNVRRLEIEPPLNSIPTQK